MDHKSFIAWGLAIAAFVGVILILFGVTAAAFIVCEKVACS
jgi:hypothetical protein